jgi:hypothetical protein
MRLQNQIKNAISKWIERVKSNPFAKNDNRWIPCLEDFCLDKNPKIYERYLLWGWGRQTGFNPQDYSWVIYDPKYPDRFQISWKRGNYNNTIELCIKTGEDKKDTIIKFPAWPEDCEDKTDIENQLEKAYVEILNQLLLGKDVQISFQHSKNRLHVKTVQVKKII